MKKYLLIALALVVAMVFIGCNVNDPLISTTLGTPSTPNGTTTNNTSHTHKYGEWVVVKYPTLTETGLKERTCSCGIKETESIPKLENGFELALVDGKNAYEVVGIGTITGANIVIPDIYNGYPVIGISNNAFRNIYQIKTVTLPDTIQYIGYDAFRGCGALESINLPNSITDIQTRAFYECYSLKEIIIPKKVTEISAICRGCTQLERVILHENITRIEYNSFQGCESLKSIDISMCKITEIEDALFSGCKMLESVILPELITRIGIEAFKDCEKLTEINLPESVTSLGKGAFHNCKSLTSINIPSEITEIPSALFSGCISLAGTITIPDGVIIIDSSAFFKCIAIEQIIFEANSQLECIGERAFSECTLLNSISLGDGEIVKGKFVLPSTLEKIGAYAFSDCVAMKYIVIPASMTFIDNWAFENCTALTTAHFIKTTDWHRENYRLNNDMGSSYFTVSAEQIADPELMAKYLTVTYPDKRWSNY